MRKTIKTIKSVINMDKRTYRIRGEYITDITDGYTFKIEAINKDGIIINTKADNGAEIVKTISWNNIKR